MKQSEIEKKILEFWRKDDTFKKSVERKAPKGEYVFYDGPPFATGAPHYGHIVASLIKDMVPRYWTMRGFRVERRWGWDCHGLPIENIVEREHGFKHKKDILAYGVDKFNEDARSKVLQYVDEWQDVINRLGRWVDFNNDYKTMDLEFMESVWWVFKELYDKGLLYEAYRSMHICPRCETTLAQSEVAQGYQEVTDLSVVAKFKVKSGLDALSLRGESPLGNTRGRLPRQATRQSYQRTEARLSANVPQRDVRPAPSEAWGIASVGSTLPRNDSEVYLLAWTTTPWTLPGNAALAVGEDIKYVGMKVLESKSEQLKNGDIYIFSEEYFNHFIPTPVGETELSGAPSREYYLKGEAYNKSIVKIFDIGSKDLVGLEYEPLFPYYDNDKLENRENAYKVYAADFVNTEEGTGIVHIAPAFGHDDYELSKKEHIPFIQHVKMDGTFDFPPRHSERSGSEAKNPVKNPRDPSTSRVRFAQDDDFLESLHGVFVKHQDKPNTPDHPESSDAESTDVKIVKYLAKRGLLFSKQKYKHTYPHCWRCDSPLLNYSTSSWFVAVEKIKKDLLKNAEKINWMPKHIKEGRFGQWLEGARDWSISRQRFWGSVIPVWKCTMSLRGATRTRGATRQSYQRTEARLRSNAPQRDVRIATVGGTLPRNDSGGCGHAVVIGSIAELEKLSGQKITDLHKHFVDPITFPCKECGGEMRRIPDVLDCWFESGSMPYAQAHFPAEFIAEGVDQTRAWFYYLHVLATALKKRHAFKHAVVNGIVLAEDGKKMSKRLQNYPDPADMFEKYGADAVRYYLAASPVMAAEDLRFSEKEVDEVVKKVLLVLYNVLAFYKMYAPSVSLRGATRTRGATRQSYQRTEARFRSNVPQRDDKIATVASTLPRNDSSHVLDRWIIAKTNQLIADVTDAYDKYDLNKATRPIAEFVNELSTWYLRRSRERIKSDANIRMHTNDTNREKGEAIATLRWVLERLALVMAPVTPFTAEYIWQELGNKESVHLQDWPEAGKADTNVLQDMAAARELIEVGLAARAQAGIKIRQPLASVTLPKKLDSDYETLVEEELNVEEVLYGKDFTLDTKLTDTLRRKGNLRELIRTVQIMRKKAGLTPGDSITLTYQTDSAELKKVFEQYGDELKKAVIAGEVVDGEGGEEIEVNGEKIKLSLRGAKPYSASDAAILSAHGGTPTQ